jgi:hypothetical protein
MNTVRKYMLINKEVKILWQMCEQPKSTVVFLYLDIFRWPVMTKTAVNSSYNTKDMAKIASFWGETSSRVHGT